MMHGKNYQAWNIKESDYPRSGNLYNQLKFILGYAILAPSTFNSQPWRCKIQNNKIILFLDLSRITKSSDKTRRFAYVSMGSFIENLTTSANYFGWNPTVTITQNKHSEKPNLVLVANLSFEKKIKPYLNKTIFRSITVRATNRSLSLSKNIPENILKNIRNIKSIGVKIIILEKKFRDFLAQISYNADIAIWSNREFRLEHLQWIRNNLTKRFDGMPGFGVGISLLPSFFAAPVILSPIFPKLQASKNMAAIKSTPNLLILSSEDNTLSWIKVGMLFERISLFLTSKGLVASPLGQFIENDHAREKLQQTIKNLTNFNPQVLLRIGYPKEKVPHSPRIPVNKILI